jgi:hypothetical protein
LAVNASVYAIGLAMLIFGEQRERRDRRAGR